MRIRPLLLYSIEPVSKPTALSEFRGPETARPKSPASPSAVSTETGTRTINTPIGRVFGARQEISVPPVCTENLNPDVMVMEAAQDRV
jgi:hypothetical protein